MMLNPIQATMERVAARPGRRQLAKVLLADSDLASRLSLKSLLVSAGYGVDGAASGAEAMSRLDEREYQLVLADLRTESEEAGSKVLAYARQKDYRPATALIASEMSQTAQMDNGNQAHDLVRMTDENVSYLLANVAELISDRASRRMRRARPAC